MSFQKGLGSNLGHIVFYQINGSGRDSYISTNNGGFCQPRSKQFYDIGRLPVLGQRFPSNYSTIEGKRVIYSSNGSGRDSYISFNYIEATLEELLKII